MSKPHAGLDISFKHVSYSVTLPNGQAKEILKDVTGFCQSGRLLALMGRSGAGKTTLLDVLACQVNNGLLSGEVLVEGRPRDPATFKKARCYVMQKDVLLSSATVREALTTSALLRLPKSIPRSAVRARVEALIQDLGLQQCADTLIGDEATGVKGVSGGEKRRCSIGLELVTRPSVVFLDEPTSGLDSDTALTIVLLLNRFARQGLTVVCTIHQPSSDIMESFSDLMLLAEGRCCYCGPYSQAVPFFSDAGFPCPIYKNPADFFIALTGSSSSVDLLVRAMNKKVDAGEVPPAGGWPPLPAAADDVDSDQLVRIDPAQLDGHSAAPHSRQSTLGQLDDDGPGLPRGRAPVWYQTWILAVRFFRTFVRNPVMLASEVFQYVFFGISVGLMYLRLTSDIDKAPFNRASALWFVLVVTCFTPSMTAITSWEAERQLLRRETAAGSYSLAAFYTAKTLVVTPFEAVLTSVFTLICYFMIGLQPTLSKFMIHLLVMILFQLSSETVGVICAVVSKAAAYAIIILSLLLTYLLSFSGFLLNETPVYFRWIPKISYLNYAYVALMKNEVYGLELRNSDGSITRGIDAFPSSVDNGLSITENVVVLGALTVGMRILGYVLLLVAHKLKFV